MSIPAEYYKADQDSPYAEDVAGLIEQLRKLPPDLPIKQGLGYGCSLVVYNVGEGNPHLEIEDAED